MALADATPTQLVLVYMPNVSNTGTQAASGIAELVMLEGEVCIKTANLPRLDDDNQYVAWVVNTESNQYQRLSAFNTATSTGAVDFQTVLPDEIPNKHWNLLLLTVKDSADATRPSSRHILAGVFRARTTRPYRWRCRIPAAILMDTTCPSRAGRIGSPPRDSRLSRSSSAVAQDTPQDELDDDQRHLHRRGRSGHSSTAPGRVSNNVANAATPGYKQDRLPDEVGKTIDLQRFAVDPQGRAVGSITLGPQVGVSQLDLTPGPIQETSNPLDLAIAGAGYSPPRRRTARRASRAPAAFTPMWTAPFEPATTQRFST